MQELVKQFRLFSMKLSYPADGPDCIEGGFRMIRSKRSVLAPVTIVAAKDYLINKHLI